MWRSKFISPIQIRWRIKTNSNSTFPFSEKCHRLKPSSPANVNLKGRMKSYLWRNTRQSLFLPLAFPDGYLEVSGYRSATFKFHWVTVECYRSQVPLWVLSFIYLHQKFRGHVSKSIEGPSDISVIMWRFHQYNFSRVNNQLKCLALIN